MEKWKACQLAFEYFKTNFFVRNKQRINSKRGFKIKIFYIFSFLILTSCFNKNITSLNIRETPLSGKLLTITRLDQNYKKTKDYFLKLSKKITNKLHTVGFEYCPADMMASNPEWCLSLSEWKSQFNSWITKPSEKSIMMCTIFFDYNS